MTSRRLGFLFLALLTWNALFLSLVPASAATLAFTLATTGVVFFLASKPRAALQPVRVKRP
jgi:hypothetical protein